ncbi:MAG: DUF1929 domain-containing protein, partial [candidate division Zixibacteria bacterium]|nr:DUF1929 domain-containing protein [candidate division Zixibacteria bacterium]
GIKDTHLFDPFSETWTRVADMADGRWYPTMVSLPDGKIVVFSGLNELTGDVNQDIEIYDPDSGTGWRFIAKTNMPLYPRMAALSPKDIFFSGPTQGTAIIDIENLLAYKASTMNFGPRWEGTSVLLPRQPGKVMVIGGHNRVTVTETVEIIDLNDSIPAWSYTQPLNSPRMHANAVILPDGKIVVVGGENSLPVDDTLAPPASVYDAEIFDPETETWSVMAAMQRPREYHSTAILLPDARILLAGSNGEFTAEIFSPPYLFLGPRPIIQSAPEEISYATNFELQFTSPTDTNAVSLIRLSSVTHSINMDQRFVPLADLTAGDGSVTIFGPASANLAPPGYYMLFVVNSIGVPSRSVMVRVTTAAPNCCVNPGDADGSGSMNISDITYLIARIFASGQAPVCCAEGDADGSGAVNIADITYLIARIFAAGPAPVCGPGGIGC